MMNQREIRLEQRLAALEAEVFGNKTEAKAEGPRTLAGSERRAPADERLDLNTATAEQVRSTIKGVGPKTAADFINARANRPFTSFADVCDRVGGIDEQMLADHSTKVRVGNG